MSFIYRNAFGRTITTAIFNAEKIDSITINTDCVIAMEMNGKSIPLMQLKDDVCATKALNIIFDKISAQEPITTDKIKKEAEKEIHLGYDTLEQINVPSDSNEIGDIGIELDEL